jgi:hypothetical protein
MRYLSMLLLSVVISTFVSGAAEGLCPRITYVDNTELWSPEIISRPSRLYAV